MQQSINSAFTWKVGDEIFQIETINISHLVNKYIDSLEKDDERVARLCLTEILRRLGLAKTRRGYTAYTPQEVLQILRLEKSLHNRLPIINQRVKHVARVFSRNLGSVYTLLSIRNNWVQGKDISNYSVNMQRIFSDIYPREKSNGFKKVENTQVPSKPVSQMELDLQKMVSNIANQYSDARVDQVRKEFQERIVEMEKTIQDLQKKLSIVTAFCQDFLK